MIIFDQLRISDDGRRMYINVHVNVAEYFDNVYLDSITIMTADKISETNIGSPTDDYIYKARFCNDAGAAALVLTAQDFNENYTKSDMSNTLFFVYVTCKMDDCKNRMKACISCRLDELTTVGVTFDENLLHQKVMDYTRDVVEDCSVLRDFINFILLWNAFKSSIETEHWIQALKFYRLLFDEKGGLNGFTGLRKCGCHG